MAQHCFVLWPDPGEGEWIDSGQGGLFAYLVYRALHIADRSDVDVGVQLITPALPLEESLARQLWAPPWPGRTEGEEPLALAAAMRTAIYLGSTGHTLVHRDDGRHFRVCRDDLTRDGDAVAHVLDYEYSMPGDILTFLMPGNGPSYWRRSRRPPPGDDRLRRIHQLYRRLGRGAPDG